VEENSPTKGMIKKGVNTNIYRGPHAQSPCQYASFEKKSRYDITIRIKETPSPKCFLVKDLMVKKKSMAIGE
jgi:hypothetical protein